MTDAYIAPAELHRQLQGTMPPLVIDVRDPEEYAAGHIPGALHFPEDVLPSRLGELPRGRPVVTY
jgi:rhodanese-related sulfurtransferase